MHNFQKPHGESRNAIEKYAVTRAMDTPTCFDKSLRKRQLDRLNPMFTTNLIFPRVLACQAAMGIVFNSVYRYVEDRHLEQNLYRNDIIRMLIVDTRRENQGLG